MSYYLDSASRVLGDLAVGVGLLSISVLPAGVQVASLTDNGVVVLGWVGIGALIAVGMGVASYALRRLADHEAAGEITFGLDGHSGSAA